MNNEGQILAGIHQILEQIQQIREQVQTVHEQVQHLGESMTAIDKNNRSRLYNSHIDFPEVPFIPLCDPITGIIIPWFPATPAALARLSAQQITNLLTALHEDAPGGARDKQKRLRFAIGIKEALA